MRFFILFIVSLTFHASWGQDQVYQNLQLLWADTSSVQPRDSYVAFRGTINATKDQKVELKLTGASWYAVWANGVYFTEGPDRYTMGHPEYTSDSVRLRTGKNVIAIQAHYEGVTTRLLKNIPPFIFCAVSGKEGELKLDWKCRRLDAYASGVGRINPQLGWVEWCDTRKLPDGWQQVSYNDASWVLPVSVDRNIKTLSRTGISTVKQLLIKPVMIKSGKITEMYGYERDNISARFFLRELDHKTVPAQGVFRRYDLGRVRLGKPRFILDLPAGAIVEFGYSEYLQHDRVVPWINLSDGDSHNIDHYVARGGQQEFFPITPKGGRFLEVHVLAPDTSIKFITEDFIERTYHDAPSGSFVCSDTVLNKIWYTGIETYRACTEDAVIDNPTRERGQWTGDVTTIGMKIANTGFADLRLIKKALMQSALSARTDGMVAGLCPGGDEYLSSYAIQWFSGCINYYTLTGDTTLLNDLFPYALRNLSALEKFRTAAGINKKAGWAFIDWGYVGDTSSSDMALNIHYALALKDWIKWCTILRRTGEKEKYSVVLNEMVALVKQYLDINRLGSIYNFNSIGYHKAVLAAQLGIFNASEKKQVVTYLKQHILNCFPNNPDAPRLSDPGNNNAQIITPYFAYYAFPVLIENGEIEFVLEQYRKCWGWALEDNRTTWLEVFDPRWSHCHQWSGSPTWQLSKYILGLSPRFDERRSLYEFSFVKSSLSTAHGKIPINGTGNFIDVRWKKQGEKVVYSISTQQPVWIRINNGESRNKVVKVSRHHQLVF